MPWVIMFSVNYITAAPAAVMSGWPDAWEYLIGQRLLRAMQSCALIMENVINRLINAMNDRLMQLVNRLMPLTTEKCH